MLYVFANAIRDVLGLAPFKSAEKLNSKEDDETRFGRTRPWPMDRVQTPVRGSGY